MTQASSLEFLKQSFGFRSKALAYRQRLISDSEKSSAASASASHLSVSILDENAERIESILDEKQETMERLQLLIGRLISSTNLRDQQQPPISSSPTSAMSSSPVASSACRSCRCCRFWQQATNQVARSENSILALAVVRMRDRSIQQVNLGSESFKIDRNLFSSTSTSRRRALHHSERKSKSRLANQVCNITDMRLVTMMTMMTISVLSLSFCALSPSAICRHLPPELMVEEQAALLSTLRATLDATVQRATRREKDMQEECLMLTRHLRLHVDSLSRQLAVARGAEKKRHQSDHLIPTCRFSVLVSTSICLRYRAWLLRRFG